MREGPTDKQLFDRYLDGEAEAVFKHLTQVHGQRLYGHARGMMGTHEDADDALQNALIKVWQNLHRFKGNSSFFTWMYRITTNECLNLLAKRKNQRLVPLDQSQNEPFHSGHHPGPDGDEIQRRLESALSVLPDKQKQVFLMRYQEEMSYKEMAEITGTSVGALKSSYHIAMKKVETRLRADQTF